MRLKRVWKVILILVFLIALIIIGGVGTYSYLISPVEKGNDKEVIFVIKSGTSTQQIAKNLMDSKLIHNDKFFVLYLKINKINNIKASSYKLKRSMAMGEIISIIESGKGFNPDEISITFKEGKNIRSIAKTISENTNNKYDDVINKISNKEYIDTLIKKYWFLKETIKNDEIYYPLEGYLFPNTYKFDNKDVSIEKILERMLVETNRILTSYKSEIEEGKYSVHEILTLASIVELEGLSDKDRPTIASVFYNRLKINMSLGSDVTACYAQKIDDTTKCHLTANFNYNSKYNTRLLSNKGIPIGPICNPSESSIRAVINPSNTEYLYFVADKNTNIYFFKTQSEFKKKINELKANGDWLQ